MVNFKDIKMGTILHNTSHKMFPYAVAVDGYNKKYTSGQGIRTDLYDERGFPMERGMIYRGYALKSTIVEVLPDPFINLHSLLLYKKF